MIGFKQIEFFDHTRSIAITLWEPVMQGRLFEQDVSGTKQHRGEQIYYTGFARALEAASSALLRWAMLLRFRRCKARNAAGSHQRQQPFHFRHYLVPLALVFLR
jgi:hypothetical protein